jgi:peptide-methionine (S)-S-oxide reductase
MVLYIHYELLVKMEEQIAIFGAGCFWHVEEVFSKIKGVIKTRVGYTGGGTKNPTYEQVSSGKTGHAEAIEIIFDSEKITYKELLDVFWKMHNPTSLNRQGPDIGTNYRSAIFCLNQKQKEIAIKSKKENQKNFTNPIVTNITMAGVFYPAEEYHQKYFKKHENASCRI